jgi:hypothetical protein
MASPGPGRPLRSTRGLGRGTDRLGGLDRLEGLPTAPGRAGCPRRRTAPIARRRAWSQAGTGFAAAGRQTAEACPVRLLVTACSQRPGPDEKRPGQPWGRRGTTRRRMVDGRAKSRLTIDGPTCVGKKGEAVREVSSRRLAQHERQREDDRQAQVSARDGPAMNVRHSKLPPCSGCRSVLCCDLRGWRTGRRAGRSFPGPATRTRILSGPRPLRSTTPSAQAAPCRTWPGTRRRTSLSERGRR